MTSLANSGVCGELVVDTSVGCDSERVWLATQPSRATGGPVFSLFEPYTVSGKPEGKASQQATPRVHHGLGALATFETLATAFGL